MLDKGIRYHFQMEKDNRNVRSLHKWLNKSDPQKPNDLITNNQLLFMRIYTSSSMKCLKCRYTDGRSMSASLHNDITFWRTSSPSIRRQSLLPYCNSSFTSSWFFWLFFICSCCIALSATRPVTLFCHFVGPVVFFFHFSLI